MTEEEFINLRAGDKVQYISPHAVKDIFTFIKYCKKDLMWIECKSRGPIMARMVRCRILKEIDNTVSLQDHEIVELRSLPTPKPVEKELPTFPAAALVEHNNHQIKLRV